MKNLRPETLDIVQRVEALSGCPVEFKPDSGLSVQATLQKARHGATAHVLRYKPGSGPLDYWVAYQCGFALRPRWPGQIPPPLATPNSPRQDGQIMTTRG